jgi:hypothetical protein
MTAYDPSPFERQRRVALIAARVQTRTLFGDQALMSTVEP